MEDEEHDRKVLFENLPEDVHIASKLHPCPCPELCNYECNICTECGRKESVSLATIKIKLLREAIDGGLQLGRDELAHCQWAFIGKLRNMNRLF